MSSRYLNTLSQHSILSRDEERILIEKAQRGCIKSRDSLITSNMRLIISIISKLHFTSCSYEDLIAPGVEGLIHAIDKFELDRNCKLSTYATLWIYQSVTRYLQNTKDIIRIPIHIQKEYSRFKKLIHQYELLGTFPTIKDISKELNVSLSKAQLLKDYHATVIFSLHILNSDESSEHQEYLIDSDQKSLSSLVQEEETKYLIQDALCSLNQREREVIQKRYGIQFDIHTLQDLGNTLHLSRERIRQIELEAMKKLGRILRVDHNLKFKELIEDT